MNISLRICLAFLIVLRISAQPNQDIRLNQIGFYTHGPKIAAVIGSSNTSFSIKSVDQTIEYQTGILSAASIWEQSGESVKIADFSSFTQPGRYVLVVNSLGHSFPFEIQDKIFVPLNKALLKAFFYNRNSFALEAQYAGKWARAAGHPDDKVIVHAAAASLQRPAGTILSCPKGWYDAGDYNSYIVNSGISTYSLLISYEHFRKYYDTLNVQIPESKNNTPDILDEIKWNLDWMLTMQDPNDGGVYNKKTNAGFDGFIMPAEAIQKRYVVQKSTSSACDFAAVMATAYRVYRESDPDYAVQCLEAAKKAYQWGTANPSVTFTNPGANGIYPAITTGGYGDGNLSDELEWAGNELYIATKDDSYYRFNNSLTYGVPTWGSVRTLGLLSLIFNRKNLTTRGFADTVNTKSKLLALADRFKNYQISNSPYKIVMGISGNADFVWGSNSQAANQAMILLNAYLIENNPDYAKAALSQIDYIMGRNALSYSYVTGFGSKKVMNIHHRPSGGDNNLDPVPGWVVGGPTSSTGDGCLNNPTYLAKSFYDQEKCYTKTEIAINWNAPAVYITGAIESLKLFNFNQFPNGLDDMKLSADALNIYPVPAADLLNINFVSPASFNAKIYISDLKGRQMSSKDILIRKGSNEISVSVADLANGIFMLKIETEKFSFYKKISINKN